LGVLAAAVVALSIWALRHPDAPTVLGRPAGEKAVAPVPRIDLARVDAPRPRGEAGRRDLFAFGRVPEPEPEEAEPADVGKTPPASPGEAAAGAPGAIASGPVTPTLPPLNLKYIGSIENKAGVKVAVLITDRKEILTGQAGQVVANRYRIARIGLESVDLEDVGSGQSRRVPLKGN
jgi:hypothetical protein